MRTCLTILATLLMTGTALADDGLKGRMETIKVMPAYGPCLAVALRTALERGDRAEAERLAPILDAQLVVAGWEPVTIQ